MSGAIIKAKLNNIKLRFALALVLPAALAACGVRGPAPIEIDPAQKIDRVESAETLRSIYHSANQIETFRGSYQGLIESPAGRIQFRLVAAFLRPEKLRLEVFFSGLNRLASLLTVVDGELTLIDANNRRVYSGPLESTAIARLTGVPLSAAELMLWFSGRYRPENAGQIGGYQVYGGIQPVAVFQLSGQRTVIIRECAGQPGVLDAFELRTGPDKEEALLTRYNCKNSVVDPANSEEAERQGGLDSGELPGENAALEFRPAEKNPVRTAGRLIGSATDGPLEMPGTIKFWLPQDRAWGTLTLEHGKLNSDLSKAPKALFAPPIPAGLERLPLSQADKGALIGVSGE